MDVIFFERQQAALCAQHALNMLLQGDYFSANDLAEIARRLDREENVVLDPNSRNSQSVNMDDSGYFSVQVLSEALKTFNLELISITHPSVKDLRQDPLKAKAFICNQSEHWFTLRKFGNQWFVLNSVKAGPELISDTYLSMYLHQLQQEGYSIFIVRGILPDCDAEREISMCPVKPQPPPVKEGKIGVMGGIGKRLGSLVEDLSNKVLGGPSDYESDMDMAIRRSLADDVGPVPNEMDEEELLRKAIEMSKQENVNPSSSASNGIQVVDAELREATQRSLDPTQAVQVREIPIQLVGASRTAAPSTAAEDEIQRLRAKREAFLNNIN